MLRPHWASEAALDEDLRGALAAIEARRACVSGEIELLPGDRAFKAEPQPIDRCPDQIRRDAARREEKG